MSILIIKLVIILFPGLFSVLIIRKYLIPNKKIKGNEIIVYSTVFGFVSYLIYQSYYTFFRGGEVLNVWQNVLNDKLNIIEYNEVIISSLIAIVLSIIYVFFKNKKWDYSILNFLNVTDEISDSSLFSLYSTEFKTVYVIDIENKIAYLGNLVYHCESKENKEIGLTNVTLYSISIDNSEIKYLKSKFENQKDIYLSIPQQKTLLIINSETVESISHV